jgi:hypothetical protein
MASPARGVQLDVWDIVVINGAMEWSYYVGQYDKDHKIASPSTVTAPDHCSAFVATGSYTKDGNIVIAHNNWTGYMDGSRWTIAFDIQPANGTASSWTACPASSTVPTILVSTPPASSSPKPPSPAFQVTTSMASPNSFALAKPCSTPPPSTTFARIFKDGNNGGYANDWLIADTRRNEIASLELGLKNVTLERKIDGYFCRLKFSD